MEAALEGPVERGHPGLLRRLQEGLHRTGQALRLRDGGVHQGARN